MFVKFSNNVKRRNWTTFVKRWIYSQHKEPKFISPKSSAASRTLFKALSRRFFCIKTSYTRIDTETVNFQLLNLSRCVITHYFVFSILHVLIQCKFQIIIIDHMLGCKQTYNALVTNRNKKLN